MNETNAEKTGQPEGSIENHFNYAETFAKSDLVVSLHVAREQVGAQSARIAELERRVEESRAEVERLTKERDAVSAWSGEVREQNVKMAEMVATLQSERDEARAEAKGWQSDCESICRAQDNALKELAEMTRLKDYAEKSWADQRVALLAQLAEREEDRARLDGLVDLIQQNGDGEWEITLCYDNSGDAAAVIDSEGNIIGECGDISKSPPDQFRDAIDEAIRAARAQEDGK